MIKSLLRRKRAYEKYFLLKEAIRPADDSAVGEKPKPKKKMEMDMDTQAQNAYTSIVKTIVELSRKSPKETKDPAEMKRIAEEILRTEYGIER